MKINVVRFLIIPWFLFFTISIIAIVMSGSSYRQLNTHYIMIALGVGSALCLLANIQTLSRAGIWITYSLPISLKYSSWPWLINAIKMVLLAGAFYLIGKLAWIPLVWQAFIIPAVFTFALFYGLKYLLGPILMWSSRLTFSRTTAFLVSLPVFTLVPVTAYFLGNNIVTSYLASQPELRVMAAVTVPEELEPQNKPEVKEQTLNPEQEEKAKTLQAMVESGQACPDEDKLIQSSLTHTGPEELVYWAVQAVKCSDLRSVLGLPRLAKIMIDHPSAKVRAAAIRAMPKFGYEQVKQIGYLLVKRINEREDEEVIQAATVILARMGEDERKWATNRLKSLLNSAEASGKAAKVLVKTLKNQEVVTEYVAEHILGTEEGRSRAVSMICELPEASRSIVEPHIDQVVASIKTGSAEDPAINALECMGSLGYQAIRKEVLQPQFLDKAVAARALAEMDVKHSSETLKTAEVCVEDNNLEVRKWCSQSLGRIGAPALPKILDLLESNNPTLKDAGRTALNYFNDPMAKDDLVRIREENSGWMANKKKLQVAEAVATALIKIQQTEKSIQ